MTTNYDPKINKNFSIFNENYLCCDEQGGLTTVNKLLRPLPHWWIGKLIHWAFYPNENISRVRDVFNRQVSDFCATASTNSTLADFATLHANATYFNDRVIKKHNDRWICSILFWCKVPLIATDQLEKRLKSEISTMKSQLEQSEFNPEDVVGSVRPLLSASKALNALQSCQEGAELEDLLKKKQQSFATAVEQNAQRIDLAPHLTDADFTFLVNDKHIEQALGSKINLPCLQGILQNYATSQHEKLT